MGKILAYFTRRRLLRLSIFLLFCVALYPPLFYRLDAMPVYTWDEALFALRAFHYLQFGEYMENFNFFPGLFDHRNTKLPFTTFFQVVGLKLFGINELGVRLPIAFIFTGTLFYCCYYFKKYFGSISIGYWLGLLLVSSTAFVQLHMLRTGDHDVPFACYLLLAVLFFHRFMETNKSGPLIAFSIAMIAALLTKNLLAGLLFPGLLAFALHQKALVRLLKDPRIYLALFFIAGTYAATVGYFEWRFPGFIDRMWNYELMGRYSNTIEEHSGNVFYYAEYLLWRGFMPFSLIMIFTLLLVKDKSMAAPVKNLILLAAYALLGYLVVISLSETKTSWYSAPLFPLAALITALGLHHLFTQMLPKVKELYKTGLYVLAACLFIVPYKQVMDTIISRPVAREHRYQHFIKDLADQFPDERDYILMDPDNSFSVFFYTLKFNNLENAQYDLGFQRLAEIEQKPGYRIVTCHQDAFQRLTENYTYNMRYQKGDCMYFEITGKVE